MDKQSKHEVGGYRRNMVTEPTIEQLKAAINAEKKKMSAVQKSIDNWTQIISDIDTGLQVSQPIHSEWKTRYDYQRSYNQLTKQHIGSLKNQLHNVKNGQTPVPEENTSNLTATECQHYVKTLLKEKRSLQSLYDSYSRQLDDTSREYHQLQDEIYSIVNDICYGQDSRIKLQEERDRKQDQQHVKSSQSIRKQCRKPRDRSRGKTLDQSKSRRQSHERNQKKLLTLPKLPPIKKETSTVSSPGNSYLDLYNQRKLNTQSNLQNQFSCASKSGPNSKAKKKNKEIQVNNVTHSTLPSISRSVPQTRIKEKRQEHFKLPSITAKKPNLVQGKNDIVGVNKKTLPDSKWTPSQQLECKPWVGEEMSPVVMDEGPPPSFGEIVFHQVDTPPRIVMEEVPPTVTGILRKVPKIYTENEIQKDEGKKRRSVKFSSVPEIIDYT